MAGLAGVVLGGLIATSGQWLTATAQQRQMHAERAMRLADGRRSAYADYVKHYLRIRDQMREINAAHRDFALAAQLRPAYEATWKSCVEARGPLFVAGPHSVTSACQELHRELGKLSDIYDAWLDNLMADSQGGRPAQWPGKKHDDCVDVVNSRWETLLREIHSATNGLSAGTS